MEPPRVRLVVPDQPLVTSPWTSVAVSLSPLLHKRLTTGILRGRPSFSSFMLMIISIIRGGRGLKNDDKYNQIFYGKNQLKMQEN